MKKISSEHIHCHHFHHPQLYFWSLTKGCWVHLTLTHCYGKENQCKSWKSLGTYTLSPFSSSSTLFYVFLSFTSHAKRHRSGRHIFIVFLPSLVSTGSPLDTYHSHHQDHTVHCPLVILVRELRYLMVYILSGSFYIYQSPTIILLFLHFFPPLPANDSHRIIVLSMVLHLRSSTEIHFQAFQGIVKVSSHGVVSDWL